jgi:hypothetical protein
MENREGEINFERSAEEKIEFLLNVFGEQEKNKASKTI